MSLGVNAKNAISLPETRNESMRRILAVKIRK
jgi:hypothetical protein